MFTDTRSEKEPMDQISINREARNNSMAPLLSRMFQMIMVTISIMTMERRLINRIGNEIMHNSSKFRHDSIRYTSKKLYSNSFLSPKALGKIHLTCTRPFYLNTLPFLSFWDTLSKILLPK